MYSKKIVLAKFLKPRKHCYPVQYRSKKSFKNYDNNLLKLDKNHLINILYQ